MESNKYIYTYYEILENFPHELNAKTPLIHILRYITYKLFITFYFFKNLLTLKIKPSQIFSKKEITHGRENNEFVDFKPEKEEEPIETDSTYLSFNESEEIIRKLAETHDIDIDSFNLPFKVKIRKEIYEGNGEDKDFIVFTTFKFIKIIKQYLKDPFDSKN